MIGVAQALFVLAGILAGVALYLWGQLRGLRRMAGLLATGAVSVESVRAAHGPADSVGLRASATSREGTGARSTPPAAEPRFSVAELSLAAMIEELEAKERDILARLEERERAILALLNQVTVAQERAPSAGGGAGAVPAVSTAGQRAESGVVAGQGSRQAPATAASRGASESTAWLPRNRVHEVKAWVASGLPTTEIAKRLGIGVGEVELIARLYGAGS